MRKICEAVECLADSPQRLQILDALEGAHTDLRDLMAELDSPRSTLQRNLFVLEERNWIEKTPAGYTTTTTGCLIREEVVTVSENTKTIQRLAPFLAAVDTAAKLDIDQLNDSLVIVPEPTQPDLPRKRLTNTFSESDHVRGFLPVVSSLSVELSRRADDDSEPEGEYVISANAFATLRQQYGNDGANGAGIDPPDYIDVLVYDGGFPYGLFVSNDALVLSAYNQVGRIQALVESTSDMAIEWGEQLYGEYRHQSMPPNEIDVSDLVPDSGIAD